MENLTKVQRVIIIGAAVIMLLVIGYYIMHKTQQYSTFDANDALQGNSAAEGEQSGVLPPKESASKTIIIHITGAVKTGGVIQLSEGDRIIDAIDKAGGITEDADLSKVNLAYVLEDGQKVYIPSLQDEEIIKTVTDGSGDDVIVDGDSASKTVNINRANQTELETLSGIGPSTALKIIEYRKEHGNFKKIEDLLNVPGIGQAKFDAIKGQITI